MIRILALWICKSVIVVISVNGLLNHSYGEPLPFDQVPYVYAQDRSRFQQLWQDAMSRTVRVAMFGDSQETSPGGQGKEYIPRFSYELWRHYGNVPETQVVGASSFGGGIPPAEWLLRGNTAAPKASPSRLLPAQILPGMAPRAHSTKNKNANINGQQYGQLTALLHDAVLVNETAAIPIDQQYFDSSGVVRAEIFAATNPSSGEVNFLARPIDTSAASFFAPITTSGTVNLDLESDTFQIKSALTPPLDYDGKTYMSAEFFGNSDSKLTDIIGVRYRNESNPSGVMLQDFSAGGYRISSFLDNHNDAGPMFASLGFEAAVLHYGANDAGAGVGLSAEGFKANTETLIARLREWLGAPTFPVILMGDPYRERLSTSQQFEFDRYPGVQLEIAQADPDVMVVNSRRLSEDIGWGASGEPELFLSDGVHYTSHGAKELARIEVETMLGAVPGDVNLDGLVNVSDLSEFALNFGTTTGLGSWLQGDFNHDGAVGVADLSLMALNFGSSLENLGISSLSRSGTLEMKNNSLIIPEPSVWGPLIVFILGRKRYARR